MGSNSSKLIHNGSEQSFHSLALQYKRDTSRSVAKYKRLKDMDLFVLDNSIRESTVGQLRGHTIDNKWEIYNEVKKCGFKHTIVASFNHMTRVDDVFIKQLVDRGEDRDGLWAFSEITENIQMKIPDTDTVPIGLQKLKDVGLYNVIFEIDLGDSTYDFKKVRVEQLCALLKKWILWVYKNLNKDSKILVNFRDLPDVMPKHTERVFYVVDYICRLKQEVGMFGIIFEEPRGKSLPEECGMWAIYFRKIMNKYKWQGHLLVHVHEKFGYSDVTALEVLMNGANGIWGSICIEGASMGNASSCVTLLNMIRLGNRKVLKQYNCTYLRQAAINVTKVSTGEEPHIKQPVYGGRALDLVFDMNPEEFDLASFFNEKPPIRITTLSSPEMICQRMVDLFGNQKEFTEEMAYQMKEVMLQDLKTNRKEEYMSKVGLAVLFDRAGGKLTSVMMDAIAQDQIQTPHGQKLIAELRSRWDEWDAKDKVQNDDKLEFSQFYNGFMAPYFACYRCNDTIKAWSAIDMNNDGQVDWDEFMVYVKWALQQYQDEITDVDQLLDITFRKGIIPAMRDELGKQDRSN